ncbi:MAG: hypothetical protein AKCLJLPJ_02473 [Fimbriimonadales bacterium]|nr:hypothetical protein [Fimbriimonadales bacterium]
MFALIVPVMTSTLGRCVAITRWIPVARASCARRQIEVSTSFAAWIMRSANSSITTTMYGNLSAKDAFALKASMLRHFASANTS